MISASYRRVRAWRRRQMNDLRLQYRNECELCGDSSSLQFAHRHSMETLRGPGRGSSEIILDIKKHPLNYRLLCKDCHYEYDRTGPESIVESAQPDAKELERVLDGLGFVREEALSETFGVLQ